VLARLHQAHLLSEKIRVQAVERMAHLAVETPDAGWLHLPAWKASSDPWNGANCWTLSGTSSSPKSARTSTGSVTKGSTTTR
jgi:hypothetical protein